MPFKTANDSHRVTDFPFQIRFSYQSALEFLRQARSPLPAESPSRRAWTSLIEVLEAEERSGRPAAYDPDHLDDSAVALLHELKLALGGGMSAELVPSAIMMPFMARYLVASPDFMALQEAKMEHLEAGPSEEAAANPDSVLGIGDFTQLMLVFAYTVLLESLYGLPVTARMSPTFTLPAKDGRPERSVQMGMDMRFLRVEPLGDLPPLSDADRNLIMERLSDVALLQRILDPAKFRFTGFLIGSMTDVTDQVHRGRLRQELTATEALTEVSRLNRVQESLRVVLGKPQVEMNLIVFDEDYIYELHPDAENCEYQGFSRSRAQDLNTTFFGPVMEDHQLRVAADLSLLPEKGEVERTILAAGLRSVLAVPLLLDDQLKGLLVLGHPEPAQLSGADIYSMAELLPSFALAVVRGLQHFQAQVRSYIQEQYTSIHPAVEWKFRRAAIDHLMGEGEAAALAPLVQPPIVFENVYPLYSVSDIRSSSTFRNEAIRADLVKQLDLARAVVSAGRAAKPMPYLDELDFRIDLHHQHLEAGISTGDEIELLQFLSQEIEPAFAALDALGGETKAALGRYRLALHAEHRSVYERRRDFDQSVTRLNRAISAWIDRVQPEAQAMFGHYFDKNSTDGVDMNMYIGPTMTADGAWNPIYLRNLRLWQLIVSSRVARLAFRLKDELPLPLQTTHLIVVQDMPITIRFNPDEKRFAVDGAYNIRYEIMKKRIDKATIKGSGERLTQPDQIAIVYSQHTERQEYERYIAFLQAKGYLEQAVEHLEIDDLQGISGLKALRVAVRMPPPPKRRGATKAVSLPSDPPLTGTSTRSLGSPEAELAEEDSIIRLIEREFAEA